MKLGEMLVEQGIITPGQLDLALLAQPGSGRRLGEVLTVLEIASQEEVRLALEQQCRDYYLRNRD